jgi:hypothetical protein
MALFAFVDVANVCSNAVSGEYSPEYHLTGRHPDIERRFKFTWGEPVVSLVLRRLYPMDQTYNGDSSENEATV